MRASSLAFAFGVAMIGSVCLGAWIPIEDVYILPTNPTESDPVVLFASGQMGSDASVTSFLTMNGGTLTWDLYFDPGQLPIVSSWSESVSAGTLSAGTYLLQVRTFNWDRDYIPYPSPEFADEHETLFTVTPEPSAGLLVLAVMGIGISRRQRRW